MIKKLGLPGKFPRNLILWESDRIIQKIRLQFLVAARDFQAAEKRLHILINYSIIATKPCR